MSCCRNGFLHVHNCAGLAVFSRTSSERFLPPASEMAGRERDMALEFISHGPEEAPSKVG